MGTLVVSAYALTWLQEYFLRLPVSQYKMEGFHVSSLSTRASSAFWRLMRIVLTLLRTSVHTNFDTTYPGESQWE
jgi:hypothetical protein